MASRPWDGDAFRQRMRFQETSAENYAREHSGRLRRGQGNGSSFQRDQSLGEAYAYGSLAASAATESPDRLLMKLEAQLASPPDAPRDADADAWTNGFKGIIRSLRAEVRDALRD